MWTTGWRERVWSSLEGPWDLIVIGGGITGAGILREATRAGFRTLLDHAPHLRAEKGDTGLRMIEAVRAALDPERILNPGKLVD